MAAYYKELTQNDLINNEYIINIINKQNLSIQAVGSVAYSIQGNISDKENWGNISLVNLNSFDIVSTIDDEDIYTTDIQGIDFIKIIITSIDSDAKLNIKAV